MKILKVTSIVIGSAVLIFAFQNCSGAKHFEVENQAVLSSVQGQESGQEQLSAKPVVSCLWLTPGEDSPQGCLEYNNYTEEQYGLGNCLGAGLIKGTKACPRTSGLIGRCKSSADLDVWTYRYAPNYATQAQRDIAEQQFKENCEGGSQTWESL